MLLVSLSLAAPQKRLNKDDFLRLGTSGQKKYLEKYPKSKHRFLLKGKTVKKGHTEPVKQRRLTRTEYDGLSDKAKAKYDERYPKSRHKPRFKGGKGRVQDTKISTKESRKDRTKRSKETMAEVDKQRKILTDDGAGVINRESVKALENIKPEHLKRGANNIDENRDEIHDVVDAKAKDKPHLFDRGLSAVRDLMQGDAASTHDDDNRSEGDKETDPDRQAVDADGQPEFDADGKPITEGDKANDPELSDDADEEEEDEEEDKKSKKKKKKGKKDKKGGKGHKDKKKQRDGKAVLGFVVKAAILGAGVTMLALGAGPLGMIVARGLLDTWEDFKGIASTAADGNMTPEEQNYQTVNEIITQTQSYLRNMDMDDLHAQSKEMFSAIASSHVDVYGTVFNAALPLVGERPKGIPGKSFYGHSSVDLKTLATTFEKALSSQGILRERDHVTDPGEETYLFYTSGPNRTIVAVGMNEDHGLYHVSFLNW